MILQENEGGQQNAEENQNLINIDNANFSNKKSLINSPRTLQACFKLGIDPSELYQLTLEEFKLVNPDVRYLPQDMIKFRYEAEEKYRNDSINQVKEERQKIIEEEEKKNEEKKNENEKEEKNKDELGEKMEKIKEEEKKALEKIKKK